MGWWGRGQGCILGKMTRNCKELQNRHFAGKIVCLYVYQEGEVVVGADFLGSREGSPSFFP